jgi:hypothetical protein
VLSSDQRFTLIMLAIGTAVGLIGWFLRYMIGGMRSDTEANTNAITLLTKELSDLRIQLAERAATEAQTEAADLRRVHYRRRRAWLR